jgi:hypothetical protein
METSIIASVTHPPSIVSARQLTLSGLSCGLGEPLGLPSSTDGAPCQGSLSLTALGRLSLSRGSAVAGYLSVGKAST